MLNATRHSSVEFEITKIIDNAIHIWLKFHQIVRNLIDFFSRDTQFHTRHIKREFVLVFKIGNHAINIEAKVSAIVIEFELRYFKIIQIAINSARQFEILVEMRECWHKRLEVNQINLCILQ